MPEELTTVIPELDNAAIRRTTDGRCSVYDLIAVIGQQKNPHEAWKRLLVNYPEVLTFCENFKFSGKGQRKTPVTNSEGWAYIIGLLPGVMGRKYRESAAKLVIRYLDADITLAAEVADRNDNQQEMEWLEARVRGKIVRHRFTGILKSRGVIGRGYGTCTNRTYVGLFGTNAAGLRKRKNLPSKANWRDHADTSEIVQLAFTEDLTGKKALTERVHGNEQCAEVCYKTAKKRFGIHYAKPSVVKTKTVRLKTHCLYMGSAWCPSGLLNPVLRGSIPSIL